jgi:hypothetical protein
MNRSFGITVRPRNGIEKQSVLEKKLIKYCEKCEYHSYVFEKEYEARHCHIQLFFEEAKNKGDIKKQFMRICEACIPDWDAAQKKVCVLVKLCYNDWIECYCIDNDIKADDYSDNICHNPPLCDEDYYPTEEEQMKFKTKSNAVDQRFHRYTELYNEHTEYKDNKYPSLATCALFIGDLMFVSKQIPVIIDDKARKNVVKCFWAYYNGRCDFNMLLYEKDKTAALLELCCGS